MKKILVILIAVIIVIFIVFKAIATEPPAFLPVATVGNSNPGNGTTLGQVLFGSTTIVRPTTASSSTKIASKIESVKFNFTGYGPGKEHVGTFKDVKYDLKFGSDGKVESGTVIISASSVDAGNTTLNKDLCSATFFNCTSNPNIVFSLNKITLNVPASVANASGTATGILNFKGKTKTISFPFVFSKSAKPAAAAGAGTYSADFRINMRNFYSSPLVNDEVRIQLVVAAS